MPADQLVREVVYNELNDHVTHGYWRYWVESHTPKESLREEFIETAEGPVSRIELSNGRPLNAEGRLLELERLHHLLNSPTEQARHRQEYIDNENRIGRIVAMLPDAFLYEYAGEENGCYRLRFRPNPDYPAHSIEARIFHSMSGELRLRYLGPALPGRMVQPAKDTGKLHRLENRAIRTAYERAHHSLQNHRSRVQRVPKRLYPCDCKA
jgi:hypothetical protein